MQALTNVPIIFYILITTAFVWMFNQKKDYSFPQLYLITAFFIIAMFSVALSGWLGGALLAFQELLPIWILYIILSTTVINLQRVKIIMLIISASALILALHGIEQYHTGSGWTGLELQEDRRIRYLGIFNDPNDLGLLFVSAVPLVWFYQTKTESIILKIVYISMLITIIYGLYLTDSRGNLLGLGLVILLLFWRKYGFSRTVFLGMMFIPLILMLPSRLDTIEAGEDSALGRIEAWYEGFHMLLSNPLFGVGINNFTEYNTLTAHNSFVLVYAETGLVGYYFWLSFIGITFYMLVSILNNNCNVVTNDDVETKAQVWKEYQQIAWALLLSITGYMSSVFFLSRSYNIYLYILFGLVAGFYMAARIEFNAVQVIRHSDKALYFMMIAIMSIIAIFVITKILLIMAH